MIRSAFRAHCWNWFSHFHFHCHAERSPLTLAYELDPDRVKRTATPNI